LIQHFRRASYQAGHVCADSIKTSPTLPSPSDWGGSYSMAYGSRFGSQYRKLLKTSYAMNAKQAVQLGNVIAG